MSDHEIKVLLVEDDEGLAELEMALLEQNGFRVELAALGSRALECLESCEDLALMVLDYRLPDMTGADILEKLGERIAELPVLVVTGYPDPQIEERMRSAGVADFIVKDMGMRFLDELPRAARAAVG